VCIVRCVRPCTVQFLSKTRSFCSQSIFTFDRFVQIFNNRVQLLSKQNKIRCHLDKIHNLMRRNYGQKRSMEVF
jgi:hypothetical protein